MRKATGRPLLMLACRHHVEEVVVKHVWKEVSLDESIGPENQLFKLFKTTWPEVQWKDVELSRFNWSEVRGTWLEEQARQAKQQLKMLVRTEAFRNSEVRFNFEN